MKLLGTILAAGLVVLGLAAIKPAAAQYYDPWYGSYSYPYYGPGPGVSFNFGVAPHHYYWQHPYPNYYWPQHHHWHHDWHHDW